MKKILFAILSCLVVNIAIADDSLPKININASYKNVMESKVVIGALVPVLNEFRKGLHDDYLSILIPSPFKDDFFNTSIDYDRLEDIRQMVPSEEGLGRNFYFYLDRGKFSEELRERLNEPDTDLTVGLLYNTCLNNAWTEDNWYRYEGDRIRNSIRNQNIKHKEENIGANAVCALFIEMIVLKHNQVIQESGGKGLKKWLSAFK